MGKCFFYILKLFLPNLILFRIFSKTFKTFFSQNQKKKNIYGTWSIQYSSWSIQYYTWSIQYCMGAVRKLLLNHRIKWKYKHYTFINRNVTFILHKWNHVYKTWGWFGQDRGLWCKHSRDPGGGNVVFTFMYLLTHCPANKL